MTAGSGERCRKCSLDCIILRNMLSVIERYRVYGDSKPAYNPSICPKRVVRKRVEVLCQIVPLG